MESLTAAGWVENSGINASYDSSRRWAWIVVGFTLAVILWGAFVRATGSGAGCGSHWPLCNGTVVPREPQLQTLIEFSHRLSSGLCLLSVFILRFKVAKVLSPGAFARRAANWACVGIVLEALIGAGIVLLRLVGTDQSVHRAVSIALHLVNTSFLMGALILVAFGLTVARPRLWFRSPGLKWPSLLFLLGFMLIGMAGAITALGDTLFRPDTLAEGWRSDFDENAHFLQRMRIIHPMIALLWGVALSAWILRIKDVFRRPGINRSASALMGLIGLNIALGLLNVGLLAPVALQILHLLFANLIWIVLVWFVAQAASEEQEPGLPIA